MAYEVHVLYYAAARDLAGRTEQRLALPREVVSSAELRALLSEQHAALAPYLARMRLAVNDELPPEPLRICAGDHVAVLPPVAGGSGPLVGLRETALSVDEAIAAVSHPGAGGVALFLGVVRDHAEQGAVTRLDYEAHPSLAQRELEAIIDELLAEQPGVRLCALHRVGSLAVGEIAVVVAASAAHRAAAFDACRAAIERIKQRAPIWKKEWAPDGRALWVNLEG